MPCQSLFVQLRLHIKLVHYFLTFILQWCWPCLIKSVRSFIIDSFYAEIIYSRSKETLLAVLLGIQSLVKNSSRRTRSQIFKLWSFLSFYSITRLEKCLIHPFPKGASSPQGWVSVLRHLWLIYWLNKVLGHLTMVAPDYV